MINSNIFDNSWLEEGARIAMGGFSAKTEDEKTNRASRLYAFF